MSTATANLVMNPKSLLLIFGGMTLSFGLILTLMLAAVDNKPKSHRKTTRHRIQQKAPSRTAQSQPRSTRRERPIQQKKSSTTSPSDAAVPPPPTVASETLPAPAPGAATPIAPNKAAMQQLTTLKQDLNRELQALKKDRDAMLKALAQSLVVLPPKEIAHEISAFDDRSAVIILRELSPKARGKVLEHIETKRAQKLKKRLK